MLNKHLVGKLFHSFLITAEVNTLQSGHSLSFQIVNSEHQTYAYF